MTYPDFSEYYDEVTQHLSSMGEITMSGLGFTLADWIDDKPPLECAYGWYDSFHSPALSIELQSLQVPILALVGGNNL